MLIAIYLNKEEIAELPDDSVDVFKCNMLDRYIDKSNTNFTGCRKGECGCGKGECRQNTRKNASKATCNAVFKGSPLTKFDFDTNPPKN